MKELEFLKIIQDKLTKTSYIGDDCAYLKDLEIVITQDSLVENIHFSTKFATPYQIGYKSVIVNISDILASGAIPKYVTISLSLPKNTDKTFISEFYQAVEDLTKEFDFEVIGGDITGSEKIFISICAIGLTKDRKISSRKNAKIGDLVVTTGVHGSSSAGLWLLQNVIKHKIINKHLIPDVKNDFSNEIATKSTRDYAMMDTSDGLADALYKIAQASNVLIYVDLEKVPYEKEIEEIADKANVDYKDWIMYGGEDFQIVACVDKETLSKINPNYYTIIGEVKEKNEEHFVEIQTDKSTIKISDLEKTFDHFSE